LPVKSKFGAFLLYFWCYGTCVKDLKLASDCWSPSSNLNWLGTLWRCRFVAFWEATSDHIWFDLEATKLGWRAAGAYFGSGF
jgi:hypothetical protein